MFDVLVLRKVAGSLKCKLPWCTMDIRIRFYAYGMTGVADHVSDWSAPNL